LCRKELEGRLPKRHSREKLAGLQGKAAGEQGSPWAGVGLNTRRIFIISTLTRPQLKVYSQSSMRYKLNQVEQAIFRTFGARDARVDELRFRLKRLLVTDRRLGRDVKSGETADHQYASYSQEPPGSGIEVMFSGYEAFALLAAITLLEHGLPQARVVRVMRQARRQLEAAHAQCLAKDRRKIFDQKAILAQAKPGILAINTADPVYLVFVRLTEPSVGDHSGGAPVAVCRSQDGWMAFMRKHSDLGPGVTLFEFSGRIHTFAANLSQTRPAKRGR
jgi:hypothetical protein